MALKTDYVDDELAVSMGGKRQFNIVDSNGNILYENVHIEDTSKYSTVGDDFGAEDINATNEAVNKQSSADGIDFDNTGTDLSSTDVEGAIKELLRRKVMKCALFGETTVNATAKTIDISELGLTSADDYMVLLDADQGGSLVTKTATSFSLEREGSATVHASYQVITFV